MSKEVEEAIDNLEDLLYHSGKYEYAENCDKYDKSIETVLNYIKELENKLADSTSNEVIKEEMKRLEIEYDEITSKYTEDELDDGQEEYDDWLKMDRISEKLSILRKILRGEKK